MKLSIKPFKVKPRVPESFEADSWRMLESALKRIYGTSPSTSSYSSEELYKTCEAACKAKLASSLYKRLYSHCQAQVLQTFKNTKSLDNAQDVVSPSALLESLDAAWKLHCKQTIMIRSIFLYLDRTWILQTSGVQGLWDMGLHLFRDYVVVDAYRTKAVDACLQLIERDRNGDIVPRQLLKSVIGMFLDLGIYKTAFEPPFLQASHQYYILESTRLVQNLSSSTASSSSISSSNDSSSPSSLAGYLIHVHKRLVSEGERCNGGDSSSSTSGGYLHASTRKSSIQVVETDLIGNHRDVLLESGFDELVSEGRVDDLARFYVLFSRVYALDQLQARLAAYIVKNGLIIVMDPEKDSNMVESLLVFKSKLTHLISSSFRTNPSYNQALTKSFESFINKRENRPAELIAKYLDALLKSGGGSGRAAAAIAAIRAGESNAAAAAAARVATAANDEQHPSSSAPPPPRASLLSSTNSANSSSENVSMLPFTQTDDEMVEQVMGEVISLFRYVEGKDVFEAFYKKDLAKRLLMGKSASIDLEKSMVARIRAECGAGFTSKLEGMFRDIDLSRDLLSCFKETKQAREEITGFELGVSVITASLWPTYAVFAVNIPQELENSLNVFKSFYEKKHNGKQLKWIHSLGTSTVKANFKPGDSKSTKEFTMSLYQAMCLLLFNNNNNTTGRKGDKSSSDLSPPSLTYNEILAQTNIPPAELYTTLQSLALAKVSPLKMTPRSKEINRDTSKFTVNTEFKHPLYRIKLNTILMKETAGEGDKCREKVFEDRKSMIDCHVVRILKMRKRMEHRELVGEVFKMARFPIKAVDLKHRIEHLIEREFLARDEKDSNTYVYVA